MQPDDRLLVDGQETARITSLSLRTIERLVSMGRFPRPVRLGRRRLWDRRKLEEWVAAGCPGA
jgi:excisionase family DNA binding protein